MDSPKKQASKILRDKKMYQRWLAIFMCLALVVTSGTVTALKLTGQAMTAKQLQCSYVPHEHTDECYNDEGELICGLSDKVVHTHDSSCYDAEGNIVCTLEELEPHEHDDSCYTEVKELICGQQEHEAIPAHHHTEECYTTETADEQVLTCGLEETDGVPAVEAAPGHVHTDACYTTETVEVTPAGVDEEGNEIPAVTEEQRTLACGLAEGEGAVEGQPEIPAHHHTEECYTTQTTETQVLTCGLEEHDEEIPAHHHTDECYTTSTELTCGKDEVILHVHTDDCYEIVVDEETGEEISRTLTCTQPQLEAHQHGDECFVEVAVDEIVPSEQPEEELPTASVVYCGKDAHTHTDECYQQDENGEFVLDENGEKILVCELEEHTHTEECYAPAGEPEVELLTATKTVGDVTVTVEYSEDANIPEGAELDFFEYAKDSEVYQQRQQETEEELDRLFNIGFYLDGEEIEPAEGAVVKVNITYAGVGEKKQAVTHFTDEGAVAMGTQTSNDGANTTVEFYTDSFSDYGVTLAADDNVVVLKVGESKTIYAESGEYRKVSWTSANGAVTVSGNGRSARITANSAHSGPINVTFNAERKYWFFVSFWDSYSETFTVYVVDDLVIDGTDRVRAGNTIDLTLTGVPAGASNVQWSASGTGAVSITNQSSTGAKITGSAEGPVTITASYTLHGERVSATHSITVLPAPSGSGVEPGQLNVSKYIEDTYKDGTYDLNLTFNASKGSAYSKPQVDVLFVVDTSGSMKKPMSDSTRAEVTATAINNAIAYLKGKGNTVDARYAVALFANGEATEYGWTSVSSVPNVTNYGSNNGGTNYEAGLHCAYTLLSTSKQQRPEAQRIVIFLSDGVPTFRYTNTPGDSVNVNALPTVDIDVENEYIYGNGSDDEQSSWWGGNHKGHNMKAAQNVVKALESAGLVNQFYTIGVGNASEYGNLNNLTSVLGPNVTTGNYDASKTEELNKALGAIVGKVADVFCSQVTAVDHLQSYVEMAASAEIGGKPNLTVSVVDKDGKLIASIPGNNGTSASLDVTYTGSDEKAHAATFTATYDEATRSINASFSPSDYVLNPDWTYKITARVKLDETKSDQYVTGGSETNKGDFATLPNGVYTNVGNNKDIVHGKFDTIESTMPFPRPIVPEPRTLNITKVDLADAQTKLSGAVFTLYRDNKVVGTFTTKADGTIDITGIVTGEYVLKETKAPEGYSEPDENDTLLITVYEDATVEISPSLGAESKVWTAASMTAEQGSIPLTVKNTKSGVPVVIIKEGVTGLSLENAAFTLTDAGSKLLGSSAINHDQAEAALKAQSGNKVVIFPSVSLPVGDTTLTETTPPAKYQQNENITITVAQSKEADAHEGYLVSVNEGAKAQVEWVEKETVGGNEVPAHWQITVINEPVSLHEFTIFKVDSTGEQNKALTGAEFILYKSDKDSTATIKVNGEDTKVSIVKDGIKVTEQSGKVTVDGIALENGATYYLVETKAPAGYQLGGEPITLTFNNGSLSAKVLASNSGSGTEMASADKDGNWTVKVTNNPGVEMPHTGGMGTRMFTVGGGLLMVLAAGLYFWNKRRISEM